MNRPLVLLLMLAASVSPAFADEEAGNITSVKGNVQFVHLGAAQAAIYGQVLEVGDELDTSANGRVEFQLSDGSLVSLTPNSRFRIDHFDYADSGDHESVGLFSLFEGGLRAVTGAISRFQHRVEITTPVATIGIRGTEFVGELGESGADVAMIEGTGVYVRHPDGEQLDLNQAGHSAHVGAHRGSDGALVADRLEPLRMLRSEELQRLQARVDWLDHERRERLRTIRAHFERMDRSRQPGESILQGPRFHGGHWDREDEILRAEGYRPLALRRKEANMAPRGPHATDREPTLRGFAPPMRNVHRVVPPRAHGRESPQRRERLLER